MASTWIAPTTSARPWWNSSPSSKSFFACGVAASLIAATTAAGMAAPDAVFANVGKLLLATKIYDMHRLAHHFLAA